MEAEQAEKHLQDVFGGSTLSDETIRSQRFTDVTLENLDFGGWSADRRFLRDASFPTVISAVQRSTLRRFINAAFPTAGFGIPTGRIAS